MYVWLVVGAAVGLLIVAWVKDEWEGYKGKNKKCHP